MSPFDDSIPPPDESHVCPMCSLDFTGAACHSSCPMARGCRMIRCPRCAYEFVEEGLLVSMIRRILPGLATRT